MEALADALLDPAVTFVILRACRALALQLVMAICSKASNHSGSRLLQSISTFSKVLPQVPEAAGIVLEFLQRSSSIFDCLLAVDPSKTLDQVSDN